MIKNNSIQWLVLEKALLLSKASLQEIGMRLSGDYPQSQNGKEFFGRLKLLRTQLDFKIPLQGIVEKSWEEAESIIDSSARYGIHLICWEDELYPSRLRQRGDAPLVIYYRGNPGCLNGPHTLGIVGTRNPTYMGKQWAFKAGYQCAQKSIIMVSGMARGCDQEAHLGTLEGKGQTIGVLAFGLERIRESYLRKMEELILENQGCLMSEYPPETVPRINYFVARNRIISALGDKLLVVETGVHGGTMHTVRFALEDKKPIGCWYSSPEPLKQPLREGNQVLIEQGWALPLKSDEDLNYYLKKFPVEK